MTVPNLSDTSNWKLIIDQERSAREDGNGNYIAIPAFELLTPFTESFLAIRVLSKTAKVHWRFGGMLYQRLNLGLTIPTADGLAAKIPLRRVQLLEVPLLAQMYLINFVLAYWHLHIKLTIWKYTKTAP